MELANLLIGVAAAVAAIIAAYYAWRGYRSSQTEGRATKQPHVICNVHQVQPVSQMGDSVAALVGNAGGGCPTCALALQFDDGIYLSLLAVGPGIPLTYQIPRVATAQIKRRQMVFIVAEDVAGGWWDCKTGEFLGSSAGAKARIHERIREAGLETIASALTPVGW